MEKGVEPEFDNYQFGWGAELLCPNCSFNYLHHDRVEVYERGEDEAHCVHVTVAGRGVTVDSFLSDNPSPRRHGLAIHSWCEGCQVKPVFTVSQHKGNTVVDFTYEEAPAG